NQYDTLIIDEVHERTLNIDFLLGHLKTLLPRRPDLRLVITSATLDISRFMAFFAGAAALHIPGRSFEIETRYRPLEAPDEANAVARAVAESLEELDRDCSGDVLVFLPGEREIREVARYLRGRLTENDEIVQLFSRLSSLRQARIFKPGSKRRVILSTNVAETSLTVPRVRHVIDSGLARVSRYTPSSAVGGAGARVPGYASDFTAKPTCSRAQPPTRPRSSAPILRTSFCGSNGSGLTISTASPFSSSPNDAC
ncbi:MAG: helicase-related protein, partial [Gammaproteobacteria bacterium]